jgi:hypothetical protein
VVSSFICTCYDHHLVYLTTEFDDKSKGDQSSKSTPKRPMKHNIYAPASPAKATKAGVSSHGPRKQTLRTWETGMASVKWVCFVLTYLCHTVPVYDGRNRQLQVPEDLSNVPGVLPRYVGEITVHSLALWLILFLPTLPSIL